MIGWFKAVLVGIMGGISAAGVLTATSGELEPLFAFGVPGVLQIPALIVIGLLIGLALPDLGQTGLAFLLTITLAATIHVTLYAVPGFDGQNYTASRFNNGLTSSLFVLIFGGVFVLMGQAIAIGINVYVRGLHD